MSDVAGPNVPVTDANAPCGMVPFRRATTNRTQLLDTITSAQLSGNLQQFDRQLEGTGLVYQIALEVSATTAGNAAATAFQEDAPWSAIDSLIFSDINGQLINVSGYHAMLAAKYGGYFPNGSAPNGSSDTNVYLATTGAGATGGSFKFWLPVPIGLNRRDLIGVLGNQDRAQKYSLRSDVAPSGSIYSTAPTTLPTVNINRWYDSYAIPQEKNSAGAPQQRLPDKYRVLHFLTQSVNPTPPAGGSGPINHYLPRLGNTVRNLVLVFRLNGSRTNAEAQMPTKITFKLGDTVIWSESTAFRRHLMYERFGFATPDSGVLVYDMLTDFTNAAGAEFGDDYMWTAGITSAQLECTYPTGMGSTNNSLTIVTDDLVVPPDVDLYA
jgi:hypothetical protein